MPATDTIPRADLEPRAFLEYLYNAAVIRALPLHNTAAWLPAPPAPETGGRTIVLGAGKAAGAMAQALQGQPGVFALAADTDGIDGVEDNAGACVAPETLRRAASLGMKIDQYLDRNDAYGFFSALDDLVVTGPTHTNVNDFRAILVL